MVVSALFADETEVFRVENDVIEYIFTNISVAFVAYGKLADGAARIGKVQVEPILVAIQRHNRQLVRILRKTDAWDISPFFQWNVDFTNYFGFDVKSMYGYF